MFRGDDGNLWKMPALCMWRSKARTNAAESIQSTDFEKPITPKAPAACRNGFARFAALGRCMSQPSGGRAVRARHSAATED